MTTKTFLLTSILITASLVASPTQCRSIYFANEAPDITNIKLAPKTKELCYSSFAVVHSGISRTPLWSAEHLTRTGLSSHSERTNDFHEEERLLPEERAELSDYARSGYDRGHMSPSADMPSQNAQHESFSLANMIPQNMTNNRGIWADIEMATRGLAKNKGEIYIVSGVIFMGSNIQRIGGRVMVPSKIYKAIYDPLTGYGAAYLTDNAPGDGYQIVSIAKVEEMAGIRLFPKMSAASKQTAMDLPIPNGNHFGEQKDRHASASVPPQRQTASASNAYQCGSKRTCKEMSSCDEAMFYLNSCGVTSLDGNGDGVPCSKLCK